jgi:hypothetical protein
MNRGDFGVWEVILPAKDGQPAIPHNSRVKVGASPAKSTSTNKWLITDIYDHTLWRTH